MEEANATQTKISPLPEQERAGRRNSSFFEVQLKVQLKVQV